MIKTIFRCDKCEKEWDTNSKECPNWTNIELKVRYQLGLDDSLSASWCLPCVQALNIRKPREKQLPAEVAKDPHPTTEEMLIDLLEALGFIREH